MVNEVTSSESMTMSVTNSQGEEVIIRHCHTNFSRRLVILAIDCQNVEFIFKQVSLDSVYPIERRPIDKSKPWTPGASKSVYGKKGDWGMSAWAVYILGTGRIELPPKPVSAPKS